jgi:hypothetical protein
VILTKPSTSQVNGSKRRRQETNGRDAACQRISPLVLWNRGKWNVIKQCALLNSRATQEAAPEVLPHVYSSSLAQGNVLSHLGTRYTRPAETKYEYFDVIALSCPLMLADSNSRECRITMRLRSLLHALCHLRQRSVLLLSQKWTIFLSAAFPDTPISTESSQSFIPPRMDRTRTCLYAVRLLLSICQPWSLTLPSPYRCRKFALS